jgi:hypothetical protein
MRLRQPSSEAREIMRKRRLAALDAEAAKLASRSNLPRRFLCRLLGHRPWNTGLAALGPNGTVYALHMCRRCGKRWGQAGEEVAP